MSPLHLLYCNDGSLSNTNLSVYGTCCKVGINLVALRWIFQGIAGQEQNVVPK